jgi:hypothetical protein
MKKFTNTAKKLEQERCNPGDYGFDCVPNLLCIWSKLFQSVISQSGTYLIWQKFHNEQCSIDKPEGGCRIVGTGDLVLGKTYCYWDDSKNDNDLSKIAGLITHVVLNWDPENPIDSMITAAANFICVTPIHFKSILEKSSQDAFGNNVLNDFFDHITQIDKEYIMFCFTPTSLKRPG